MNNILDSYIRPIGDCIKKTTSTGSSPFKDGVPYGPAVSLPRSSGFLPRITGLIFRSYGSIPDRTNTGSGHGSIWCKWIGCKRQQHGNGSFQRTWDTDERRRQSFAHFRQFFHMDFRGHRRPDHFAHPLIVDRNCGHFCELSDRFYHLGLQANEVGT